MPRSTRRDTDQDYDGIDGNSGVCLVCRDADPHRRHAHYLTLGREFASLDDVDAHLTTDLASRIRDMDRVRRCVRDTIGWLRDQMETYRTMVDAQTGEMLPWWDARRQAIAAMHRTYAAIGQWNQAEQDAKQARRASGDESKNYTAEAAD